MFFPLFLIVACSWVAFFIVKTDVPARCGLGVTTVLSITTLLSNSNDNLPPTAYPKVIKEGGRRAHGMIDIAVCQVIS